MIPVGIVTTASRASSLERTLDSLRRGQPETQVHVFRDLKPGFYWNHKAAWEALFEMSDRALLLEDDVRASRNWHRTAELFAVRFPLTLVFSFFNPFLGGMRGADRGWTLHRGPFRWDQALMISKSFYGVMNQMIVRHPDMFASMAIRKRPGDYWHDTIIDWTLNRTRQKAVLASPPFFQHATEPSSVGNPLKWMGRNRVCAEFLGEETDSFAYFKHTLDHEKRGISLSIAQ